jgi:hypothetical protein
VKSNRNNQEKTKEQTISQAWKMPMNQGLRLSSNNGIS